MPGNLPHDNPVVVTGTGRFQTAGGGWAEM